MKSSYSGGREGDIEMGRSGNNSETEMLLARNSETTGAAKELANMGVACVAVAGTVILLSVLGVTLGFFVPTFNEKDDLLSKVWCLSCLGYRFLQLILLGTSRYCTTPDIMVCHQLGIYLGGLGLYGWGTYIVWFCKPCIHTTYVIAKCMWWFETIGLVLPWILMCIGCWCAMPIVVALGISSNDRSDGSASPPTAVSPSMKPDTPAVAVAPQSMERDTPDIPSVTFFDAIALTVGLNQTVIVQGQDVVLVKLDENSFMPSNPQYIHELHPADLHAIKVDMKCAICMMRLLPNDEVAVFPCDPQHMFHKDCAHRYLQTRADCPICGMSIWAERER